MEGPQLSSVRIIACSYCVRGMRNSACSDLLKTMAVMANRAEKKGKLRKESQAV